MNNYIAILSIFTIFLTKGTFGQETNEYSKEGKRIYRTQRFTSKAPKIDGHLNDSCWIEGTWSGNYLQHMPKEGAAPSQETELKVLYDNKNMYVAFRIYDNEPEKIDKQLGRRDDFIGDIIGVCFDSYHDQRTGFEFDINAGGGKLDLLLENDSWDTSWDAVWEGKVAHQDSSWTAEMRIPLSQLRYSDEKQQVWGFHSWRWINRNQEEDNWALIPRDNPGIMRSIGEIHGIENLPKSHRIELLPYSLGLLKFYDKEENNPYATGFDKKLRLGLDGKIGLSSDFTLDFTINPDFGQVEADPAVLNLTAFETFFEEKRPFFLEGKNITSFNFESDRLFYSRRIGHAPSFSPELNDGEYAQTLENTSILGAIKITGKTENGLSIGIIEGLTAKENIEIKRTESTEIKTVEPLTNFFVSRVQKDINKGNTLLGAIITNTTRLIDQSHLEFLSNNATTGGIDFQHHWKNKTYFVDAKTTFSHVQGSAQAITELQHSSARYFQRPDAKHVKVDSLLTKLQGYGAEIALGKGSNGKWRYSTYVSFRSPGLELNDLGFMSNTDFIYQGFNLNYVVNEPKGFIREYTVSSNQENHFNFGGVYLGSVGSISFYSKFENLWTLNLGYSRNGKKLNTNLLRGGPAINLKGIHNLYASINSDGSKKFVLGMSYSSHIYDSELSKAHSYDPALTYRINNALTLVMNFNFTKQTNGLQFVYDDYDNEYFLAELKQKTTGLTFRLDYAITPELTLQYFANPYISVGKYAKFKHIVKADAQNYDQLYYEYHTDEQSLNTDNEYTFSNNNQNFVIANPDFNFQQFQSNFVARWEYKTGSTLYFVWSHNRNQYEKISSMSINDNMNKLWGLSAENIFLIKFNYWFSL